VSPLRHLIPALLVLAAAIARAEEPPAFGLEQLMQNLAQVKSGRARFTEVRRMPTLDLTTQATGVLSFEAPDRLERQVLTPNAERSVVQGESLTLELEIEPGKRTRRELPLKELAALRPYFVALRATLAGDLDTLQRGFQVSFTGTEDAWRLKLVPRDPQFAQRVKEIAMSGRAANLLSIAVREKSGDSTETTLIPESPPTAPAETPTPAEPAAGG
jgi:outer membrane lipoprotein-sorting protein